MRKGSAALSVFLSLVLVVGLCPAPAVADDASGLMAGSSDLFAGDFQAHDDSGSLETGLAPQASFEPQATFADINSSAVWLKQKTDYTCTLASSAMMLRRSAMMLGKSNWSSITEGTLKGTAWVNNAGLRHSFTYQGMSVKRATLPGGASNTAKLKTILNNHQEGIVLYSRGIPHAVLLTDYTNGVFYCCDPVKGYKTAINQAWKVNITNATEYWYVSSYVPYLTTTPTHTHNYNQQVNVRYTQRNDGQHTKTYTRKCSCGATSGTGSEVLGCTWKWKDTQHVCADCGKGYPFKPAGAVTSITSGTYYISSAGNGNLMVDISNCSKDNGANAQIWESNKTPAQQFRFTKNSDGAYTITNTYSGKVLTAINHGQVDRTNVIQWDGSGNGKDQRWYVERNADGTYSFRCVWNNLYLDVSGANFKSGTNVQIYHAHATPAQRFKLIPIQLDRVSLSGASVALSSSNYVFDGKAKRPGVTVRYGGKTLRSGTDYQVTYKNNVGSRKGKTTATATVTGVGAYAGTVNRTFTITPASNAASATRPMYRMFNPRTGEHFYTASAKERDYLKTDPKGRWSYEGVGWNAPAANNGRPVYRLCYPKTGDHHYTMSASERDQMKRKGWRYEGVGWYSADPKAGKPLYRMFKPYQSVGAHHYTTSAAEKRDCLAKKGFRDEGIAWYGCK